MDTFPHCLNDAHEAHDKGGKSVIVTKIVVEHRDRHKPDDGILKIVKELRAGKWHTIIKTKNPLEKPNKPCKAMLCNGCNISEKHLVEIFGSN